jgi:hypothetical protein
VIPYIATTSLHAVHFLFALDRIHDCIALEKSSRHSNLPSNTLAIALGNQQCPRSTREPTSATDPRDDVQQTVAMIAEHDKS